MAYPRCCASADSAEECALSPFTQLRRRWHHSRRSALSNERLYGGINRFLLVPVTCCLFAVGKFEAKGGGKFTVFAVAVNRRSKVCSSCLFELATFGHYVMNAALPVEFEDFQLDRFCIPVSTWL